MKSTVLLPALIFLVSGLLGFTAIIKATSSTHTGRPTSPAQVPRNARINDVMVTEGNSGTVIATFTVSLSEPIDFTVTINYATANGTATVADSDYVATSGSVTFGFGQPLTRSISVTVNADTTNEPDETFFVNLTTGDDINISDGQGACTIVNDDGGVCTYSISPPNANHPASGSSGVITVTTTSACAWTAAPNASFITITSGASGTGPGSVDYFVAQNLIATPRTGTIVIAGQVFTVTQLGLEQPTLSIGDAVVGEGNEGNAGTARAVLTVTLSIASASEITVDYQTANGPGSIAATSPDDYTGRAGTVTFPAGTTSMAISIPIVGDLTPEPDELFFVNLSNPSGAALFDAQGSCTIADDDSPSSLPVLSFSDVSVTEGNAGDTGEAVLLASLSAPSSVPVTVDFQVLDREEQGHRVDFVSQSGTLTFPANSTASLTITIVIVGDANLEPDETFSVSFGNPTGARFPRIGRGGSFTIVNDDFETSATPKLSVNDISVTERNGGGPPTADGRVGVTEAIFTVTLTAPGFHDRVTVSFLTADGTATRVDNDYAGDFNFLEFPAGIDTPSKTATVRIFGDLKVEPDEAFFLNLLTVEGNAVIADRQGVCTILDDDRSPTPPSLIIQDVSAQEDASNDFTAAVRLSDASPVEVRVNFATQDGTALESDSDYRRRSGTLIFPAGETNPQLIFIEVTEDRIVEPDQFLIIVLTAPINATIGDGLGVCTILNDDDNITTVCGSARGTDSGTPIPDAGTLKSDLAVDARNATDVNLHLFITHPDVSELEVTLIKLIDNPGGERVEGDRFPLLTRVTGRAGGSRRDFGTSCLDFTLDDDATEELENAGGPFVGQFRKPGLTDFMTSAPGLSFRIEIVDRVPGNVGMFNCWCFEVEATVLSAQEGLSLAPVVAEVPIFGIHTVDAKLTLIGRNPGRRQISFEVRDPVRDEIRLQAVETTDSDGRAALIYRDGTPGPQIITASTTVEGMTYTSRAAVTWVITNRCPEIAALEGVPNGETILDSSRSFRDVVLSKTPRGRQYTDLYYQLSPEALRIMMFNPLLMLRSREILERYSPVIQSLVEGRETRLTQRDLTEIDSFLSSFAEKGGDGFQEAVKGVCNDLRDPTLHAEFNITIADEPRQEPAAGNHLQGVNRFGVIGWLFGLSGLVFLELTGRHRRASLKNAKHLIVAMLLLASSANWSYAVVRQPISRSDQSLRPSPWARSDELQKSDPAHTRGRLPRSFEVNQGQSDSKATFISRGRDHNLFLSPDEAEIRLRIPNFGGRSKGRVEPAEPSRCAFNSQQRIEQEPASADSQWAVVSLRLEGANPAPLMSGLNRLPGARNYFIGSDPAKWRVGVPCFERVKSEGVYPGIDMIYYGENADLEYDFIVAPGVDPAAIGLSFDGADSLRIDSIGDLLIRTGEAEVRQRRPLVFQAVNGARHIVQASYALRELNSMVAGVDTELTATSGSSLVTFELGAYDKTRPLIIDPVLTYSTYLGGIGDDEGNSITVDSAGNAYIAGLTDSLNFPASNPLQPAFGGGQQDAFVTKLDPSGAVVYSTYLGGNSQDNAGCIAVDAAGNVFVTGFTGSSNFPTKNALQPARNGLFNAFITKLDPAGSMLYSTHLGGSNGDFGSSIAVDSAGNVYVAGVATSSDFPMANAIQSTLGGAADVYVAKLNPSATQLIYSTYLGGSGNDGATGIAVDLTGNVYLTGVTSSPNFRTANARQASHGGGMFDGFVAKLNSSGTQLLYSTYLGGSGEDRAFRIAVDPAGNAYITGDTDSPNFPTTIPFQQTKAGSVDAFVTKLNSSGATLIYSTYLGGSGIDGGTAISVDNAGSAYVTGFTGSANFPLADPVQAANAGGQFDVFIARLSPPGASLDYSTYMGGSGVDAGFGIAVDGAGNAYVMGQTDSPNFPVLFSYQGSYGGGPSDVFLSKIAAPVQSGPRVSGASVEGKSLIVTGSGFDVGAKILVNGQSQKTSNNAQDPATTLIGPKAGRLIGRGQTVKLRVRNSNGAVSPEFNFTRP